MPELTIVIAGREFRVACKEGEEHFLQSAADLLDRQAVELSGRMGRLPEERMLLMAGLMLADKTAELRTTQDRLKERIGNLERELAALRVDTKPEPEEVPAASSPDNVNDALVGLATRAEALADRLEGRAG